MKNGNSGFLFWAPRVLCIVYAVFLSLFSLDVFGAGYGFWKTLLALLMHLIPVYLIIITLIIAWRWEWVGAIIFIGLGLFYIIWSWGKFDWSAYLGISGPLFLAGILFFLNWLHRKKTI